MDITQLSQVKSSTGIAKLFAEELKNSVLNSESEILAKSPGSFISLLFTAIGDLNANAFLEQQMIKREMHKNTAIKLQSLLRYLSDDELAGIFAYPASASFFIAFPYNLLLQNAVIDPDLNNDTIKKVRINKDSSIVLMNKDVFILDHSINILILNSETDKPTFNVSYDMSDKYSDSLSAILNPYINNRVFNYNGSKYVGFDVLAREYAREETIININTDSIGDQLISYNNQLMGFEVLYKSSTTNTYSRLTGYPEGVDPVNGYNYSLITKNSINYLRVAFSKSNSNFTVGSYSTIKIIIYTTTGKEGNVTFPDLDQDIESNLQFVLKADSANPFEQAIATVTPLITSKAIASTGGRNQMSFEEIRDYVINKSSENLTITPSELERKAANYDCTIEKIRHDILVLMYRINSILTDGTDYISSGMGVFRFNLDDLVYKSETKSRMLKPSDIFKYNEKDEYYYYQTEKVPLTQYLSDYRNNLAPQVCFPFFIKMYFGDIVWGKVYNMSFDSTYFTEIDYYDSFALDTIAIEKANVYRSPLLENPTAEDLETEHEGLYTISYNAVIGQNMFNLLKTAINNKEEKLPVKFKIILKDPKNGSSYYVDSTIVELNELTSSARMKSTLVTNNNINDSGYLCINNNSIIPVPIPLVYESFFYLNPVVNMKILVVYTSESMYDSRNTDYDSYLTTKEQEDKYYVSTIYDLGDVTLLEDLTDKFNLSLDLKLNETIYAKYEKDVYQTYEETVYERDEMGQIVYEEKIIENDLGTTTTIRVPKIIHHKGTVVYGDNGKPLIKYKKGDIKYDENHQPIIEKDNSYYCLVKTIPWFDRIFNVPNKYFSILQSYYDLIEKCATLQQSVIDGIDLTLGFKRTSGKSSMFKIIDKNKTGTTSLDNLALSISLGVAFASTLTAEDKEYNVENIIAKTKEYIYNLTGNVFSVSDLIIYLKSAVPSIEYIEFYSINNYDSNSCQSIHKDTSVETGQGEVLCVKMDIDEENSDFNKGNITFVPAINIHVLS